MKIRSFKYYFREAFLSLARNRMMSVTSIATVFACIFIVIVFMAVVLNVDGMLKYLEDSVGISVFLEDSADSTQVNELHAKILGIPHVSRVIYISSEDALAELRESDNGSSVFDELPQTILPRSFSLEVDDSRYQEEIIRQLESIKENDAAIKHIRHAQDLVNLLLSISNVVRTICGFLILLLTVICIIIITNMIRITVNMRKIEINIMKFIGATDWFIRWPFIIEGFLVGFIGSFIPLFICWFGYDKVTEIFFDYVPLLNGVVAFKSGHEVFSYIIPVAMLFGTAIGIVGSLSSIRKHLSV